MDEEKTTYQLMRELMKQVEILTNSEDVRRNIWQSLNKVVDSAKLDVVKDAEKQIAKLRVFSLR